MNVPDERLAKRAVVEWDLSSTVVNEAAVPSSSESASEPESASESESASEESSEESSVESSEESSEESFEESSEESSEPSTETTSESPDITLTSSTETTTVTAETTILVTITSCEDNKCSEIEVPTGVVVVTETISGIITSYTTYCPETYVTTKTYTEKIVFVTVPCEVCEKGVTTISKTIECEDECYDVIVTQTKTIVTATGGSVITTGVAKTYGTGAEATVTTVTVVSTVGGSPLTTVAVESYGVAVDEVVITKSETAEVVVGGSTTYSVSEVVETTKVTNTVTFEAASSTEAGTAVKKSVISVLSALLFAVALI
ncbi:hypothetical protein BN1211_4894 [Cyberlindnera jadinii]|uniref:Uncharacterized protein n=1 Tax=Cyberlindnera jadinii (strain ATCC 18201 / CBS 1600 / BCRC 20928 / JCM 3617 / NBRC 0987 / NRRL Y-1542) TaxID=983966 RepID=A0A0H5C7P0_CYBJN|nr:hypothetical protein BN1211_4894 [Cyberlindnera jadinii]